MCSIWNPAHRMDLGAQTAHAILHGTSSADPMCHRVLGMLLGILLGIPMSMAVKHMQRVNGRSSRVRMQMAIRAGNMMVNSLNMVGGIQRYSPSHPSDAHHGVSEFVCWRICCCKLLSAMGHLSPNRCCWYGTYVCSRRPPHHCSCQAEDLVEAIPNRSLQTIHQIFACKKDVTSCLALEGCCSRQTGDACNFNTDDCQGPGRQTAARIILYAPDNPLGRARSRLPLRTILA